MPYHRVGPNDYASPNGKHINSAQLRLWYANGQKWPGEKHSEGKMKYSKGGDVRPAAYANGGAVLGRTRDFMKEPNSFNAMRHGREEYTEQDYSSKGSPAKRTGDKSLKAIKPRS